MKCIVHLDSELSPLPDSALRILSRNGWSTTFTQDAAHLLQIVQLAPVDVVILCVTDPETPLGLLAAITNCRSEENPTLWVAHSSLCAASVAECYRNRASDVLQFPFIPEELENKLVAWAQRKPLLPAARADFCEYPVAEVLRLAKIAQWSLDLRTRIVRVDDGFFSLVGCTAEASGGNEMSLIQWEKRFVYPEDVSIVEDEIASLDDTATCSGLHGFQFRFVHDSGDVGTMMVRYQTDPMQEGSRCLRAICQDITQQKAAEFEYLKNRKQLEITQLGIENARIGVYQINHHGHIEYVNGHAAAMTGYTKSELQSMHITDLDAVLDMESWLKLRETVQKHQFLCFSTQHTHKSGYPIDVEISSHYLRFEEHLFAYCFVREQTVGPSIPPSSKAEPIPENTSPSIHEAKRAPLWGKLAGNPTVLVVDDQAHHARIAGLMLSKMGCSPAFAYHGREALQVCASQHFDVILTNLNLPVLDGFNTTRMLRESFGPNQHTPVIGMGSRLTSQIQEEATQCGMTSILEKPITVNGLLGALEAQLTLSTKNGAYPAPDVGEPFC